ncbi:protein of unknown function DUF1566, partial [Candidatus Magnetoovum chiemensis]
SISINLPKTGQETSYHEDDDGDLEKGISWPEPRFTDNGDGTVTDGLTGLMWLKDGSCLGTRTWDNALDTAYDFNANANSYSCAGYNAQYTDWRLPNVKELESLINLEADNNATWLNSNNFVNVFSREYLNPLNNYWSSTSFSGQEIPFSKSPSSPS